MKKNTSFLHRVAQDIFTRYQNKELDFAKLVVVFRTNAQVCFLTKSWRTSAKVRFGHRNIRPSAICF